MSQNTINENNLENETALIDKEELLDRKSCCFIRFLKKVGNKLKNFSILKVQINLFNDGNNEFRNKRLLFLSIAMLTMTGSYAVFSFSNIGLVKGVTQYEVEASDVPQGLVGGRFWI